MLTDTKANNMRLALHQIYVNLYVEYGESCSSHYIEFGDIPNRVHSREKPALSR
jgi:hypothetical protein